MINYASNTIQSMPPAANTACDAFVCLGPWPVAKNAPIAIDFLVDLPRGYDLFKQRMPLAERLAEITGRRLDMIPEHELGKYVRCNVLNEAIDL